MLTTAPNRTPSWISAIQTYAPILWIYGITATIAVIAALRFDVGLAMSMSCWMSGVLIVFALLKLFDVKAFAADFAKYDLIAQFVPGYGKTYPFIELGLGLLLLTGLVPVLAHSLILLIFSVGLLGVLRSLARGESLQCACVGRTLNLPLSKVAVYENGFMVIMSAFMLYGLVF